MILKCDNESSVKALRDAVGKLLGGRVVPENPPKGESASNGRVEEAGRTVRGYARVLLSQLEEKANIKLDSADVILQWLVRWSALLPSRFLMGKDNKTPYERRRGRRCDIKTEKFGEKIYDKQLKAKTDQQNKMDSGLEEGLWLGHTRNSNEILVGTLNGVVRAYAVRKRPEEEQWDAEFIK